MKKVIKKITTGASLAAITLTNSAMAAGLGGQRTRASVIETEDADIAGFIGRVLDYALGFVGLVAVLILIYGGFTMMTAAGDSDKFETGKKMLIYAIIGIVVIVLSATIVNALISGLEGGGV